MTAEAALGRTKLASYELIHRLAVGGMGEVFVARHHGLAGVERLVALKRLLPDYVDRPGAVESFIDEARLASTLAHPNIVHVLDFGTDRGEYFLTMELVLGHDLSRIMQRGGDRALTRPLAAHVVSEVARALDHVHRAVDPRGEPLGIVHRDISPSNVLVSYEGDVKLMDFGIAKGAASTYRTRTGAVRGKVPYMAPEQISGGGTDARTDLYALGVVLWELAVGRRLFTGDNELEIATKVANPQVPRPRSIDPTFPQVLEDVIMAVLEPDPERRLQNANAFGEALRSYLKANPLHDARGALGGLVRHLFPTEEHSIREIVRRPSSPAAPQLAEAPTALVVNGGAQSDAVTEQATPASKRMAGKAKSSRRGLLLAGAGVLVIGGVIAGVALTRDPETSDPIATASASEPDSKTGSATEKPATPQPEAVTGRAKRELAGREGPVVGTPDPAKLDPSKPDTSKSDDPSKIDPSKLDPSKPTSQPDPSKPDPSKIDPSRLDPSKPTSQPDPSKPDPSKIDPSRLDPSRSDPSKPDPKPARPNTASTLDARLHPESKPRLIDKLNTECRKLAGLPYTMSFTLRVGKTGRVAQILSAPDNLGRAEQCVRMWVSNWTFLAADAETTGTLTLSLVKRP